MTGHAPEYLTSQFLPREHPNSYLVSKLAKEQLEVAKKLNIPLFRSASEKRTLYYRAIKLWNSLEPLKTSHSVHVFSNLLLFLMMATT